jgi:hypothetical protein
MNHFYERNNYILEHDINKKFEEVLWMTDDEFRAWVIDMRKTIVYAWDELGIPPRVGYNEDAIAAQFDKMESFPVHEFEMVDELTGEKNLIRNTSAIGNAANQWFPTMMKTRINYTAKDDGRSIYDHFAKPELLEKVMKYARRHFKRDSFYHYSLPVKANDKENFLFHCNTGEEWIQQFEEKERQYNRSDYWIAPKKEEAEYTGYNEELKGQQWLTLTREQVDQLNIPDKCKTNIDYINTDNYQIRYFKYEQKLFPIGLKAFRISFCQYAVNFPPLTAKYLYERYTQRIVENEPDKKDSLVIYDPSAGWGGRLLGAMCIRDNRTVHYIGTDPNTDHLIKNGDSTKYNDLGEFYNTRTNRGKSLFPHVHSFQIFREGSECIRGVPEFERFRGKVDLVFTSPPYFAKEAYSDDLSQSYKKFGHYNKWREGFLRPTLETCVEWLKPNRYLLWNIADAKFGKDMLPLEQDSRDILESIGMKYIETLKMTLAQMPGGNRIDTETGKPKAKNFCKIKNEKGKNIWLKYEPIFVWKKE